MEKGNKLVLLFFSILVSIGLVLVAVHCIQQAYSIMESNDVEGVSQMLQFTKFIFMNSCACAGIIILVIFNVFNLKLKQSGDGSTIDTEGGGNV